MLLKTPEVLKEFTVMITSISSIVLKKVVRRRWFLKRMMFILLYLLIIIKSERGEYTMGT